MQKCIFFENYLSMVWVTLSQKNSEWSLSYKKLNNIKYTLFYYQEYYRGTG